MKLLPQEIRRIRSNALLELKVSPDTKTAILTKDLNAFTKDVQVLLQRTKRIKHALVVVMETEGDKA